MKRQAPSASRSCSICNDTHRMTLGDPNYGDDREVMCTHCPSPCQRCRAGGNGPYCQHTPCDCRCHTPTSARLVTVKRGSVVRAEDFPMPGWGCTFPGCATWATLAENAVAHEQSTGYAHVMERVQLQVEDVAPEKISARKFMQLVLEKYKDRPDSYVLSIGHWEEDKLMAMPMGTRGYIPIERFCAYMQLSVGALKEMLNYQAPAGEPVKCPKCRSTFGNDWAQCEKSCPIPMSPHFNEAERAKWKM